MTEEEARAKWCPIVRQTPSQLETMTGTAWTNCIGSACMMWRWDGKYRATKAGPMRVGDGKHGYCGLAD